MEDRREAGRDGDDREAPKVEVEVEVEVKEERKIE